MSPSVRDRYLALYHSRLLHCNHVLEWRFRLMHAAMLIGDPESAYEFFLSMLHDSIFQCYDDPSQLQRRSQHHQPPTRYRDDWETFVTMHLTLYKRDCYVDRIP